VGSSGGWLPHPYLVVGLGLLHRFSVALPHPFLWALPHPFLLVLPHPFLRSCGHPFFYRGGAFLWSMLLLMFPVIISIR